MGAWTGALSALGSRSGVRRVLVAYAAFSLVEFYVWLVVVLWAYGIGGATLAGAAALVQLIPAAVLSPALASVGDRLPRGTALVLAYGLVGSGAVLTWAALALALPVPAVLLCGTWLTTAIAAARPVHFAALPALARAEPEQLVSATSLSSVIDGTVRFAGPALGGLAVATVGVAPAMLLPLGLSAAAALLCLRLRLDDDPGDEVDDDDEPSRLAAALGGFAALRRSPASLVLLLVMSVDFVLTGALDILGVAYAESALGGGGTAAGLVVGATGIGALVGAAVSGALAQGRWLSGVIVGGAVGEGLLFASTAAWDRVGPVVLALAAAGIGGAVTLVAGRTLLQRTTDESVLARVFAVQESVSLLGLALGAVLAPLLVHTVGVRTAWLPLGLGAAALALLGLVPVRALDRRARWLPVELRLLRGVPFIGSLPPYGLERLAHAVRWVTFRSGETVVRAGDVDDRMFVIADGEVSVWVSGERRPGVLGPGRWFGEVAMLRGGSRTATVVAETHGRVLEVSRSAFARAAGADDHQQLIVDITATYEDLAP